METKLDYTYTIAYVFRDGDIRTSHGLSYDCAMSIITNCVSGIPKGSNVIFSIAVFHNSYDPIFEVKNHRLEMRVKDATE